MANVMIGAGDKACDLECVRKDKIREFVGPVKIIIVDPLPEDYRRRVWDSALITFANLFIGITVMTTLYFTFIFKLPLFISGHIASCTTGFQLLLPSCIIMLNPMFGGTTQLKNRRRKAQHIYLAHMSIAFGVTGAFHILSYVVMEMFPFNPHTVTGLLTVVCVWVAMGMGPILYYTNICTEEMAIKMQKLKYLHVAFGVVGLVSSSLCLCTGFLKPTFQRWSRLLELRELPWILIICCLIYTVIIIRAVCWRINMDNKS